MSSLDKNRQVLSDLIDRMGVLLSKEGIDLTTAVEGAESLIHGLFTKEGVKEIIIPETVSKLGSYAVAGFPDLYNVVVPGAVNYVCSNTFKDCPNDCVIYFLNHQTLDESDLYLEQNWNPDNIPVVCLYDLGNDGYGQHNGHTMGLRFSYYNSEEIPQGGDKVTDVVGIVSKSYPAIIEIPNWLNNLKVTTIDETALTNLGVRSRLYLPKYLKSIGADAFKGTHFNEVYFDGSLEEWCNIIFSNSNSHPIRRDVMGPIAGGGYLYINTQTKNQSSDEPIYTSPSNIVIPDTITQIQEFAFQRCWNILTVYIPGSVKTIGLWSFYNCRNIKSVSIANGVETIGSSAFCLCNSLEGITIPDSVTSIGNAAFEYCYNIKSVIIGKNVKSIGSSAFRGINKVKNLVIPNSVTSIGSSAFEDCVNLTTLTLSNSITRIPSKAFSNCPNLNGLTIPNGVVEIQYRAFEHCTSITSLTIPEGVKNIGFLAFLGIGCTELYIPYSVETIGYGAFSGGSNLQAIRVSEDNNYYKSKDGVLYTIDEETLLCYPAGKPQIEFTIPNTVKVIDDYAFHNSGIWSVGIIPNSLTKIGDSAFYGCGIRSITIPDSVTSIGSFAFANSGLTELAIPESVTDFDSTVVYECESLEALWIGCAVNHELDEQGFDGCKNLKDIYIKGKEDSIPGAPWGLSDDVEIHWNVSLEDFNDR